MTENDVRANPSCILCHITIPSTLRYPAKQRDRPVQEIRYGGEPIRILLACIVGQIVRTAMASRLASVLMPGTGHAIYYSSCDRGRIAQPAEACYTLRVNPRTAVWTEIYSSSCVAKWLL